MGPRNRSNDQKILNVKAVFFFISFVAFSFSFSGAALPKSKDVSAKVLQDKNAPFIEALTQAYQINPEIQSALRQYYGAVEAIPAARAGWLPQVSLIGKGQRTKSLSNTKGNSSASLPQRSNAEQDSLSMTAQVSQNLYAGGNTFYSIEKAKWDVQAAQMGFTNVEQRVLLDAIIAYLDLWKAYETLTLRQASEKFNQRSYEQVKAQAEVGEKTSTDVAEAESNLAQALASLINAEAGVAAAQAKYVQVIGLEPPQSLGEPDIIFNLEDFPKNMEEFQKRAEQSSPSILAAVYSEKSASSNISVEESSLLPNVDFSASGLRSKTNTHTRASQHEGPTARTHNNPYTNEGTVGVTVTVPLYQKGAEWSKIRKASQAKYQALSEIRKTKLEVQQNVVRLWQTWKASEAAIKQLLVQVKAAELNLEGKRQENLVGDKTLTDVYDAEQKLVAAQVNLISTKRDYLVTFYQIAATYGALLPSTLKLPVDRHDVTSYTEETSHKFFGRGDLRTPKNAGS